MLLTIVFFLNSFEQTNLVHSNCMISDGFECENLIIDANGTPSAFLTITSVKGEPIVVTDLFLKSEMLGAWRQHCKSS